MRRWTIEGCGGMEAVMGLPVADLEAGSLVMARREGRGSWIALPWRSSSPQLRSAWISGISSIDVVRMSWSSSGPPSASRPDTIVSQASLDASVPSVSPGMVSWIRTSRLSPNLRSPRHASASRPEARLIICRAPLSLVNFALQPSGIFSRSFAFWWETLCSEPRQPATHSLSIIQSLT